MSDQHERERQEHGDSRTDAGEHEEFQGLVPTPAPLVWHRQPALQRSLRIAGRLAQMGPGELLHRVGRMAAKRIARSRRSTRIPAPLDPAAAAALLPQPMAEDPLAYLISRTTATGFFDHAARERLARLARAQLPAEVDRTVSEARRTIEEGVDLLGKRFRPCEAGFDWLADPQHGSLWPFTVMDDADAVRRVHADVKFVWEVNRHQFLGPLARAWVYTDDAEYAEACVCAVRSWVEANPCPVGVNWSSNLEVAVRAISWLWALQLLVGSTSLTREDATIWLGSLRQHADYIANHLSIYTDPTNHLVGEAAALALICIWLPEWDDGARLRDLALCTLTDAVAFQVAEDGVDIEQATSYQRFVLDLVLQVIALADRNGVPIDPVLRSRARAMLEAVAILIGPSGRAPRIGDSDDARGLPFFTEDHWDFGELLALGAAVFRKDSSFADGRSLTESALWLGGGSRYPMPGAANEPVRESEPKLLSQGGYAVLPSPACPNEDRVVFDCGPLGYLPHCSHGHADLLSVLVDIGGHEFLVDPGTYAYWDEDGRRDEFRTTRMHNTVEVGGRDQADAFDPFKWLNIPRCGRDVWRPGRDFHYVEAWHDGYRRLVDPVRHRRAIVTLHGGWLIVDWLEGRGVHTFDRHFHASPSTVVTPVDDSTTLITRAGKHLLLGDITGLDQVDDDSRLEISTAPYSELYGRCRQAPVVRLADAGSLPAVRMTLLAVEENHHGGLQLLRTGGHRSEGTLWVELIDTRRVRVQIAARTAAASRQAGDLRTDGRLAVVSMADSANRVRDRFVSDGTFAECKNAF